MQINGGSGRMFCSGRCWLFDLSRVLRGTGGGAGGAGLGSVVHISSTEDAPDNDSELVSWWIDGMQSVERRC
jgi:hypothetical protein